MTTKLILSDESNKMELLVNRDLLSTKCEYFKSLFTKFSEKNLNEITITVPNSAVTYDIIVLINSNNVVDFDHTQLKKCKESQKIDNFEYQLHLMICLDYLAIKFNQASLIKRHISPKNFHQLFDVFDVVGYDNDVIRILTKYITAKYDLTSVPKRILERILELDDDFMIAYPSRGRINLYDSQGRLTGLLDQKGEVDSCVFSPNGQKIAIKNTNGINVWNLQTGKLMKSFYVGRYCDYISFKDNSTLIYVNEYSINTWCLETNRSSKILDLREPDIYSWFSNKLVDWSINSSKIAVFDHGFINIYCLKTSKLLCKTETIKIFSSEKKPKIAFSSNGSIIVVYYLDLIKMFDSDSGELLQTILIEDREPVNYISFSSDDTKIVYCWGHNIRVCNIEDKTYLTIKDSNKVTTFVKFSPKDQKIISWGDESVNIWSSETGELIDNFKHQTGQPIAISGSISSSLTEKIKTVLS